MKPARSDFKPAIASEPLPGTGEQAPLNTAITGPHELTGRFHRSYNALNEALIAIFEHIYLPQEIRKLRDQNGKALSDDITGTLWLRSRDQFHIFGDYDGEGIFALNIATILPGTLIRHKSASSKIAEDAINTFFSELTEYTADIRGIGLDVVEQDMAIANPQVYLALIERLCQAKNVPTAESEHTRYANLRRNDEEKDPEPKRGAYEYWPRLKPHQLPPPPVDEAADLGQKFHESAIAIPEPAFRTMAVTAYGFREIGNIIHTFNQTRVYPILSFKALKAIVSQDIAGSPVLADMPAYNLH